MKLKNWLLSGVLLLVVLAGLVVLNLPEADIPNRSEFFEVQKTAWNQEVPLVLKNQECRNQCFQEHEKCLQANPFSIDWCSEQYRYCILKCDDTYHK